MNQDLASYYNQRAKEYDRVYQIAAEQPDLLKASALFQRIFKNKSVLEIACGTGYWTEQISKTASSILATDINKSMIDIAKSRHYSGTVTFEVADMHDLSIENKFDGIFGGFIWSHIPLQDIDNFLNTLNDLIIEHGEIVFMDSKQIEATDHDKKRITRVDSYGNTFQTRLLENGTVHEVLKNFPAHTFLLDKLSPWATDINVFDLEYYWIAICKLRRK